MQADFIFPITKFIHLSCAFLSVSGFALRGYWMLTDNPLLQRRITKTLPHIIDTTLLGTAIGMLVIWQANPFVLNWITAKIIALLVYILLGMMALRFGRTKKQKVSAWLLALVCAIYIISVAYSKNALGFFHLLVI